MGRKYTSRANFHHTYNMQQQQLAKWSPVNKP